MYRRAVLGLLISSSLILLWQLQEHWCRALANLAVDEKMSGFWQTQSFDREGF